MPRRFDSADHEPLWFTEQVECPQCQLLFDGVFCDPSDTVQDLTDAPRGDHECPRCAHEWSSAASGWTLFSEAG